MAILHLIFDSSSADDVRACAELAQAEDCIVLMAAHPAKSQLNDTLAAVKSLADNGDAASPEYPCIDYDELLKLLLRYERSCSW